MTVTRRHPTRRLVFRALDAVGANSLMRNMQSDAIRIFALHGVSSPVSSDLWTPLRDQLDVRRFDGLLAELDRRYEFVSMDTVVDLLNGQRHPIRNAVALTFDDGYSNNFVEALPVLEKYGAPATFFVTTNIVTSRQPFWFDRLDYALQGAAIKGAQFEFAGKEFALDSTCRKTLAQAFSALREHAKNAFSDDRDFTRSLGELAGRFEQETGRALHKIIERDHWSRVVTAGELATYSAHPLVTIGSHTVSHLRLSFANDVQMAQELSESKQILEEWTGKTVEHFAYPNGAYDDRSAHAVHDAGYKSAVTSNVGINRPGYDAMKLNRLSIPSNICPIEIRARASGLEYAIVNRLRQITRGPN